MVADKVYDGNTSASVNTSNALLVGVLAGDIVSLSGTGSFADKQVGSDKTVQLDASLTGADAENYSLAGTINSTANISRLASVEWVSDAGGNWSEASNWAGGALPDAANVSSVVVSRPVRVSYDLAAGSTDLDSLSMNVGSTLDLATGSLKVSNALTAWNYEQSGGTVTAGSLNVQENYRHSGGSLEVSGLARLVRTEAGDLVLSNLLKAGSLDVEARSGAITQTAPVITASLSAEADNGIVLTDVGNRIGFFSAENEESGHLELVNSGVLTLGDILAKQGNVRIVNTGAVSTRRSQRQGRAGGTQPLVDWRRRGFGGRRYQLDCRSNECDR